MKDVYILARCPLRHDHCVGMKPSFREWLSDPQHNEATFSISRCPWGVVLEPTPGMLCPHCDRRLLGRQFCCAFPLEDE